MGTARRSPFGGWNLTEVIIIDNFGETYNGIEYPIIGR